MEELVNDCDCLSFEMYLPKTPEQFSYDADGNLTSDGRWNYYWDAENRLVKVESREDTPQASWRRVEWTYDAFGRRIRQTTSFWTDNVWLVIEDLKLVIDPMLFGRHIAELNASDDTLVHTYIWGLDLSGTMDGAGGVGGLLWVNQHTGSSLGAHFCAYDGNGNVVALVSADTGAETARYEYGLPQWRDEPIRVTGPMSKENSFCFSTKRTDNTSDLVLYEYRAYSPSLGRWLSRDPIVSGGGLNLYGFVNNGPVDDADALGLLVGTVHIRNWSPVVTDSWYLHRRGWLFGVSWSPPSGGEWDSSCACKPCQKVVWVQDVAYGRGSPFEPDITLGNYAKYSYAWDCTKSGSKDAAMYDQPDQHGPIVWLFHSPYSFYARSFAKCVVGRDAGKTYATVLWGFRWTYDSTPEGLGPIIY